MSGSRLTDGFREIIELRWSEFVEREQYQDATNFDSIITALVRAASKGNLRAIQSALDRLDGKIATEVEVEYPKFYTLYPKAIKTADDPLILQPNGDGSIDVSDKISIAGVNEIHDSSVEEELPTGSLRAVLDKMLASPKTIVKELLSAQAALDAGDIRYGDPSVKSVIIAGLMKLVHEGRIGAVFEVFEQIDGKIAEKYKMLGADVNIYNYSLIAPVGATKNDDGIYQIEAENTTNAWAQRLEDKNAKKY